MSNVHQLITDLGREKAKALNPDRSKLVDVAAAALEEEARTTGFTYSGFCLTSLPHKRLAPDEQWVRRGNRVALLIEPGQMRGKGEQLVKIGVPFGARARLILLYLQKEAILADSPEVELGNSMHQWLARMGVKPGGTTYNDVREQARRISLCKLTFYWQSEHNNRNGITNESIVHSAIDLSPDDEKQGSLFPMTVRLSDGFFRALKQHPVPVWEDGIKLISNKSMAIDIYVWLAYRLHSLDRPTRVSWTSLYEQFGGGFKQLFHFKPSFNDALEYALAVYEGAKATLDDDGIMLQPSSPPVPHRKIISLPSR